MAYTHNFWSLLILSGIIAVSPAGEFPSKTTFLRGINGGGNCATCTVIVAIIEQMTELHNETVVNAMERLCSYLPQKYSQFCQDFFDAIGPLLIELIDLEANPDIVCHGLGFCWTDSGRQTCHTFPKSSVDFDKIVQKGRSIVKRSQPAWLRDGLSFCDLPGIKEICKIIERAFDSHLPSYDPDKDLFSTIPTLRGSSWRGKDCNDFNPQIYPGKISFNDDRVYDSNCNGIFGINPKTRLPYEQELCGGTWPKGIAVLGDSISAHFHLPEQWFDVTTMSASAFVHLTFIIENEMDWPQLSSTTAHGSNNWTEVIQGPIDSVYLRLRQRNQCNHRDYQNIAVNGARSSSMDTIMESLTRNQTTDNPLVVFYALVGNDVCNGHVDDTFAHMTTPQEMRKYVLQTLQFLETKLPYNSTVFLVSLVDGRILYNTLKDRIHPIGRYWNKFTYSQFYDYFNCLQISPCSGWLNTNETIRNMTTERAVELSAVLQDVAQQNRTSYKHFQLYYMDSPINSAINIWTKQGHQVWELLEPVDGFHSNQYGQALTAQAVWDIAEQIVPGIFGPTNPNNFQITSLFGNQGGY